MDANENALRAWIKAGGPGTLTRLCDAIKAEIPTFTLSQLSIYVSGKRKKWGPYSIKRVMPFEVARIISLHTGIPLSKLEFKYVHRPNS